MWGNLRYIERQREMKRISGPHRGEQTLTSVWNSASHTTLQLSFSNLITLRQARGLRFYPLAKSRMSFLPDVKIRPLLYSLPPRFILLLSTESSSTALTSPSPCFCAEPMSRIYCNTSYQSKGNLGCVFFPLQ